MKLPLHFVCFGITEGKMFKHDKNTTFILPSHNKLWGNKVVYGALFICKEFEFYANIIDAYNQCSLATLRTNHSKDLNHRININVIPIFFNNLDELARLKYREGNHITAQGYLANTENPKVIRKLAKSRRIVDGIDKDNFKQLYREVENSV
jgi:hypothetical protein